jgi:hypothetical protein
MTKRISRAKIKYINKLKLDMAIYGQCFQEVFKPNLFQKIYRIILGLPSNRRRVDPRNARIKE